MVNAVYQPLPVNQPVDVERINGIIGAESGWEDFGTRHVYDQWADPTDAPVYVRNTGGGPGIDVDRLTVEDLTVTDDLVVGDDATINGDLLVLGDYDLRGNGVLGNASTSDTLAINAITTINGALVANAASTFNAPAQFTSTLSADSTVNLGNGDADAITVIGLTTYRNAANTLTQMEIDAANNRVIVGSGTPLPNDTTPSLHVVGKLYMAPTTASDDVLHIRRDPAATTGFSLGLSSTPTLIVKDTAGTQVATFGRASDTYQFIINGDGNVADDFTVDGDIFSGRVAVGAAAFSGSEEFRVVGQSRLEGAVDITTGNLTLSSGGISVTGGSSVFNAGVSITSGGIAAIGASSVTGTLDVTSTLSLGSTVASAGSVRASTAFSIKARNNGNTADVTLIESNSSDNVRVGDSTNTAEVQVFPLTSIRLGIGATSRFFINTNGLSLGTAGASFGGGVVVNFLANATTNPTSNPTGGGILYADGGAGKWRGSGGTTTTFGPAEPHCPECDRDFAWEWESPRYGALAICAWCFTEGATRGIMRRVLPDGETR